MEMAIGPTYDWFPLQVRKASDAEAGAGVMALSLLTDIYDRLEGKPRTRTSALATPRFTGKHPLKIVLWTFVDIKENPVHSEMDKFAFDPYFYVRELTDGIWEIWKSRCKALYENTQMNSSQIINIVHRQLHTICLNNIIKRKPTFGE